MPDRNDDRNNVSTMEEHVLWQNSADPNQQLAPTAANSMTSAMNFVTALSNNQILHLQPATLPIAITANDLSTPLNISQTQQKQFPSLSKSAPNVLNREKML